MTRRGLLVFNPAATTTTDRVRDVIAAALSSELDLEVRGTDGRHHATELAREAVEGGVDAVFSLGGDGTANEVLQALAGTEVAMGVLPGGGTNVLARALGLPNDVVAATSHALDRLRDRQPRRIGLGRADERWFAAIAGFGFDAAVVEQVEASPTLKRTLRQAAFVLLALRTWATDRAVHDPSIELLHDGRADGPYGICIVGNADPYTFLGPRPMQVTPRADFAGGLDVTAIRRIRTVPLLGLVGRVFTGGRHLGSRHVDAFHDLDGFEVRSPQPLALQVDGDHVDHRTRVVFRAVPEALRVLA